MFYKKCAYAAPVPRTSSFALPVVAGSRDGHPDGRSTVITSSNQKQVSKATRELFSTKSGANMRTAEDIVFNAIYARRSIRCFDESKPIEKEKITKLMQAAMAAPSACNIQPWEFIIITDRMTVQNIKDSIRQYGGYNTNTIIVICGDNTYIPWKDHGVIDCAAAMENIMIAAPTLGLGTVCIGGFDKGGLKKILSIPESVEPIGMLYVGYPKEQKKPRTKYLEEAIHWEKYDPEREKKPRVGNIIEFGPEASL